MDLHYKNEKTLFTIAVVLASVFWLLFTIGTVGIILIYLLFGYLFFLFAHSAFISYLKGTGVKITEEQFPDLHQKLNSACEKVGMAKVPDAYVLRTDFFNALATKFLGRHYVVLFSDVVDALEDTPDAIDFYIGHEIGHIHRGHLKWGFFLAPALIFPWLGAAYRRAQEYTCDRYGAHCTERDEDIAKALAVIAAGNSRARTLHITAYLKQIDETKGFWMSFNELTADYPWLTKRMASAIAFKRGETIKHPSRHWFAWVLTFFVPRLGMGGGGALGVLMIIAIIGILAAVAVPAYQDYIERSVYSETDSDWDYSSADIDTDAAYRFAVTAHEALENYTYENDAWPESFTDIGYSGVTVYSEDGAFEMDIYGEGIIGVWLGNDANGESQYLVTEAYYDENDQLYWECYTDNYYGYVPEQCQ